ncbi:MAG: hypothetical protein HHAS10_01540 [Candidatus Altimarinota bacterium]
MYKIKNITLSLLTSRTILILFSTDGRVHNYELH